MKEQLIKTALIVTGLTVASVGAYKAVEALDSVKPNIEYVGTPEPLPTETVIWQPRTNWGRK